MHQRNLLRIVAPVFCACLFALCAAGCDKVEVETASAQAPVDGKPMLTDAPARVEQQKQDAKFNGMDDGAPPQAQAASLPHKKK